MAVLTAMLLTLLVVHTPIATVDRLLHDAGHAHAATDLVSAIVDLPEHDHHEGYSVAPGGNDASAVQAIEASSEPEPAAPGLNHHHHDGPSAYGLADSLRLPTAWSSSATPFMLDNDLRKGIDAFQQDRPPKTFLDHVA